MSEEGLDEAKLILEIVRESEERWGRLKHDNLSIYIDKVISLHEEKGLKAAVVVVLGIHQARAEEIQKMLRQKRFILPTQVRIGFLDGSDLKAVFGKAQPRKSYRASE